MASPWAEFQNDSRDSFSRTSPERIAAPVKEQFGPRGRTKSVTRSFPKPVEPSDGPAREQQAICIFAEAGWGEDSLWLGSLAYSVFKDSDGDQDDPESLELGHSTRHNLELVAASRSLDRSRDGALLIAFARLCGCADAAAEFWRVQRQEPSDQSPPKPRPGLTEWKRIAKEFRADRPHSKGANFERVLGQGSWPGPYQPHVQDSSRLSDHARAMVGLGTPISVYDWPVIPRLMHVLIEAAELDLSKVINEGSLVAAGSARCQPNPDSEWQLRVPELPEHKPPTLADPCRLATWVMAIGPEAIVRFMPVFTEWKNDSYSAAMAWGVRDCLEQWMRQAVMSPTFFHAAGPRLANASRPYFDYLNERCAGGSSSVDTDVWRAWLWFTLCTFDADPNAWDQLDRTTRDRVLLAANESIARLRGLLSRARPKALKGEARSRAEKALKLGEFLPELTPAEFIEGRGHLDPTGTDTPECLTKRVPWEEFEWERDHLRTCVNLLFRFGGVWRGLKPMLLAWRALSAPGVARDLRYWDEPDREPVPEPWHNLFMAPISLFHYYAAREETRDPNLTELRGELASFCLERLVDRWSASERERAKAEGRARTNDDMLERSPAWRYCLIRAVSSLGVNPEGKGHRTLRVASEIDPDPEVRDAANQAYQQFRRGVALPESVSPRRAIMSALWWLRQAHLLGLGIQPDPDGAQRTRIKELARTKEAERADKPATRQQA